MPESGHRAWRISNYATLDGAGGLRMAGRWHSRGRRIVYLAESAAGALLEALVRVEPATQLPRYTLLRLEFPADLAIQEAAGLPPADANPIRALETTRAIGDDWLRAGASPLLRVPSAIVRETYNLLLNPAHPAAAQIRIAAEFRDPWDNRLLRPAEPEA